MNAEVLIRARKVFLENNIVEYSEACPHCSSKGLDNKLRYFYLSLEEAIYKCQNTNCLYPFDRFMFKSLIDNSVYYYEEVMDGGREAYLRVPLDEHNKYEHQNPIATDFFCDNQRNPNIEDYSFDFSDLFDDFDTDQKPAPKPSTGIENPDSLEFLDEITPQAQNSDISASFVLNENGIDNMISNILDESPIKNSPIKPANELAEISLTSNKPKSEPKLSKCMKHIEKVKNAKNQKTREKSAFATAIRKARKSQTKPSPDVSNPDSESQTQSQPLQQRQQKPSAMENLLKSANFLRPTELAKKLGSLDLRVNSNFLRNYMKVKEEKLFANEAIGTGTSIAQVTTSIPMPNEPSVSQTNKIDSLTNTGNEISSFMAPTGRGNAKKKSSVKKEPLDNLDSSNVAVKKIGKPRPKKTKGNTDDLKAIKKKYSAENVIASGSAVPKQTPNNSSNGKDVKVAPSKRKSQKDKSADRNLANTQKLDSNEVDTKKPETKKRRRNESKSKNDSTTELDSAVSKKPRKQKCPNEPMTGQIENQEQKPKQRRTTKPKPKTNSLPIEIPLQHLATETLTIVKANCHVIPNDCQQNIPLTAQETIKSCSSTVVTDSESSLEPLLGFDEYDNNVKELEKLNECKSNMEELLKKPISVIKEEHVIGTSRSKKPLQKKSVERKSKNDNGQQLEKENSKQNCSRRSKKNEKVIKIDPVPQKTSDFRPADSVAVDIVRMNESIIDSSDNDSMSKSDLSNVKYSTKIELMDDGPFMIEDSPRETFSRRNLPSVEDQRPVLIDSPHYYRKTFKKPVDQSFKVDRLLNEWDDSENEHFDSEQHAKTSNSCLKSNENSENDDAASIISIASETSDGSFAFIGEPYFEHNPNDNTANLNP